MRGHKINNNNNTTAIFLFILFLFLVTVSASAPEFHLQDDDDNNNGDFIVKQQSSSRRILHQPLFPASTSPPSLPPPPPPPPDQPFFPEVPQGGTTPTPISDQSPPPQPINGTAAVSVTHPVPIQPQETTPVKKVAIALSVGIVTLGMLSALAFYICKHRAKHADESQKLVASGSGTGNGRTISQDMSEESRLPPSTFLYIGTVEPSAQRILTENNDANASPYRKLNSFKRNDRSYRPSPDLQPLPPLTKPPPPPPLINSPPPMSSSDEENTFYTPHGSSEGTSGSRHRTSIPHSKRTSPKSRLSFSSLDAQKPIAPPVKNPAPPPPPPPPPRLVPPISIRPKLSASMINNHQTASLKAVKPQVRSPTHSPPQKANSIEKISIVKEISNSSSDRNDGDDIDGSRPKLKPLHWDKVRATSNRATVWDQLKSSSFQLNEDMMESLFGCNSVNMVPKEAKRKPVLPPVEQENRVLDPKKSQNIAILLRALNVTREEVSEALLDGNPEGLGQELLETLVKMAPTKEEEIKLRNYNGDSSRLGSAERFLKAILDIPFAFKRVEAMLYRANFDAEVNYLRKSFQTLEEASVELKNSRLFLKILDAVLRTGNRMNVGTNRGDARAFKLETLLKLADVKGADGKTTLLHFVVQEIIRSEEASTGDFTNKPFSGSKDDEFRRQGLQVVGGLSRELGNVKRAAAMDADVLSSYVSKLKKGLEKVTMVLHEKTSMESKFFESMKKFVKEAEEEIRRVMAEEQAALSSVKEVTEYFHGNAAKEEAHPYRIFMIVRDFLSILDNVCKEVGKMHDHSMVVGTGRSFRIPANASLPVLNRYNVRQDGSSDEGLSP